MQTYPGPVFATSVSVKPYVPCLVDSVGSFLLVSSIPSDSYSLSPFLSVDSTNSKKRGMMEGDLQFRHLLCMMPGCGPLPAPSS